MYTYTQAWIPRGWNIENHLGGFLFQDGNWNREGQVGRRRPWKQTHTLARRSTVFPLGKSHWPDAANKNVAKNGHHWKVEGQAKFTRMLPKHQNTALTHVRVGGILIQILSQHLEKCLFICLFLVYYHIYLIVFFHYHLFLHKLFHWHLPLTLTEDPSSPYVVHVHEFFLFFFSLFALIPPLSPGFLRPPDLTVFSLSDSQHLYFPC